MKPASKRICYALAMAGNVAAFMLAGCSSGGSTSSGSTGPPANDTPPPADPQAITVSVTPSTASVPIGGVLVLSAQVDNYASNADVSWRLNDCDGPACGALTYGGSDTPRTEMTYAAPSTAQQGVAGTHVTITVTSVEEPSKSALATVTLTRPPIDFSAQTFPSGSSPYDVVAADINSDGLLDLAVADHGDAAVGDVGMLLGVGDGTFQAATHFPAGEHPVALAAGDLNLDGSKDLVVVSQGDEQDGSASVNVLLGTASGSFHEPVTAILDSENVGGDVLAIGDFDGNGKPDVAVADNSGDPLAGDVGSIILLVGNGDGTLQAPRRFPAGENPVAIVATDLTGDGTLDLAVAGKQSSAVTLLRGDGLGTFEPTLTLDVLSRPTSMTMGDMNRDGLTDLIVIRGASNGGNTRAFRSGIDILLAADNEQFAWHAQDIRSMLTFGPDVQFPPPPHSVRAGDFNGDSQLDVVAITDAHGASVTVMPGNGDGTVGGEQLFLTPRERVLQGRLVFAAGSRPTALEVADFNLDGKPDLAVANAGSNDVTVLLNMSL